MDFGRTEVPVKSKNGLCGYSSMSGFAGEKVIVLLCCLSK